MRYIFSLLFAPWRVFAVLTMLSIGVGYGLLILDQKNEEDKAASLSEGAPPLIALGDYALQKNDRFRDEVNLAVWADPALTSELTVQHRGKGPDWDDVRYLYFLFDPNEDSSTGTLRGLALVRAADAEAFAAYAADHALEDTGNPQDFGLSGAADHDNDFDDLIQRAIKTSGLEKGPELVVVTPWLSGREAELAPNKDVQPMLIWFFSWLSCGLATLMLLKLLWSVRRRSGAVRPKEAPVALQVPQAKLTLQPATFAATLQPAAVSPVPERPSLSGAALLKRSIGPFGPFIFLAHLPALIAKGWAATGRRPIPAPIVYLALIVGSVALIRNGVGFGWLVLGLTVAAAVFAGLGSVLLGVGDLFVSAKRSTAPQPGPTLAPQPASVALALPVHTGAIPAPFRAPQPVQANAPAVALASPVQRVPGLLERLAGKGGGSARQKAKVDPFDRLYEQTRGEVRS